MTVNQSKVNIYFDRMTETYGINGAARIHKALLHGVLTPRLRAHIRAVVATAKPSVAMN